MFVFVSALEILLLLVMNSVYIFLAVSPSFTAAAPAASATRDEGRQAIGDRRNERRQKETSDNKL